MKIIIKYELNTDGDFYLDTQQSVGCYYHDRDDHKYVGHKVIVSDDNTTSKMKAEQFLSELLCNSIRVNFTHYHVLSYFYDMIDEMITFVKSNDSGSHRVELSGNYTGTYISVNFESDVCQESLSDQSSAETDESSQEWVIVDKVNEFGYCPSKYPGMFNMTMMRHAHVFNNKSDADQIAERLNETHQYHLEVLPKDEMLVYVIYNNVRKAKNRANALNDLPLVNEMSSILDAMNKLGYVDTTERLVREE